MRENSFVNDLRECLKYKQITRCERLLKSYQGSKQSLVECIKLLLFEAVKSNSQILVNKMHRYGLKLADKDLSLVDTKSLLFKAVVHGNAHLIKEMGLIVKSKNY
jgi:hypothetical protein